jgi:hypothetical protein
MDEPPASWDQQEEENPSLLSATARLANLNVNATEFVPSFGSGFSFGSKSASAPTPSLPKTPPSTPVIVRLTHDNENKQSETVPSTTNPIQSNDEERMEDDSTTGRGDELLDDENDSSFYLVFIFQFTQLNI